MIHPFQISKNPGGTEQVQNIKGVGIGDGCAMDVMVLELQTSATPENSNDMRKGYTEKNPPRVVVV